MARNGTDFDQKESRGEAGRHGLPLTFDRLSGFLYPGRGAPGVLLLSPVGYEELCARAAWRGFAETIGASGLPCLRFDYPGTADALDPREKPDGIEDWIEAAQTAACALKIHGGVSRLILVGQGFGACLATLAAQKIDCVDAIVLMMPPANGRVYLRRQMMWARMVSEVLGLGPDPDDPAGIAVAGLGLSTERVAAIRAVDLEALTQKPAPRALVLGRGGQAGVADRLRTLGTDVTRMPYEGYEQLLTDPTNAIVPWAALHSVRDWVAALPRAETPAATRSPPSCKPLAGDGFQEMPLRFGREGRLFGVICRSVRPCSGPAVLFVNGGRDSHVGWARSTVGHARALARRGIASLRFDCTAVGDSLPHPEAPAEILYSDWQADDLRLAIDELDDRTTAPIIIAARCSGAAMALERIARDPRIVAALLVNSPFLIRDPDENLVEKIFGGHRPVEHPQSPDLDDPRLRSLRDACHAQFAALRERRIRLRLIYTGNDPGLRDLDRFFGPCGFSDYPNVTLAKNVAADHNFTSSAARKTLFQHLVALTMPASAVLAVVNAEAMPLVSARL